MEPVEKRIPLPVDPEIAGVLQLLALAETPMHEMTPQEARESFAALVVGGRTPEHVVPVRSVEDTSVTGADGDLPARIYRPELTGTLPTVVLFHGGGWVIGDLETHDNTARSIARDARAVVVSVAYRLAPEAPFPAAVEDALAATRWAKRHLAQLGGNDALAVAGDSAGGNLAAVVAQVMRTELAAQLLIYPATDMAGDYPSRTENGTGYFLETATMEWFFAQYAGHVTDLDARLSPLHATNLAGLPPAVVVTAEYDPLRDEGEAYAAAMKAAGVRVEARRFDGMIHGFFDMGPASSAARKAVMVTCAMLDEVLHP
ncbi:MAG: alpha/beta hydrolase [Nocardioidaceae bacterium]